MKIYILKLLLIFVFLFFFMKIGGTLPINMTSTVINKGDIYNQPLAVTGEGRIFAKPDIAVISVGVTEEGVSIETVRQNLDTKINNITKTIKENGVNEKDIKTLNYSLNPKYDWSNGKQNLNGYSGNTSLQIKVRETTKAGVIIDQTTKAGANNVTGPNFVVDDKSKYEAQARELAIANAREKAQTLAKSLNMQLGKVVAYYENQNQPYDNLRYGTAEANLMKTSAPAPDISVGENEIVVSVTVSFETK